MYLQAKTSWVISAKWQTDKKNTSFEKDNQNMLSQTYLHKFIFCVKTMKLTLGPIRSFSYYYYYNNNILSSMMLKKCH